MALAKMQIWLSAHFCPKNVARTRVFIFEQTARNFVQK